MAEQQPKNQALRIERFEYRLTFGKTGRARYISHLDLMRAMQRVFKRARIPLWYTQGFNPHAYLMFPLPLSLGIESQVELLDVALVEEMEEQELVSRLNACMPEGLWIVSAARPVMKHTEISAAEYEIELISDRTPHETAEAFKSFLAQEAIEVEKRTKRGTKLVDIKPSITLLSLTEGAGGVTLCLSLPAGSEFNLNTSVVLEAFEGFFEGSVLSAYTKRTRIAAKTGVNFM
ncbi:MAG: TIGR03936 family radical SAM-associated protein [Ruminococcus sp.]|nr:TIGR03936 family radical SAM-associated protein [Ruminococcus sp.]